MCPENVSFLSSLQNGDKASFFIVVIKRLNERLVEKIIYRLNSDYQVSHESLGICLRDF